MMAPQTNGTAVRASASVGSFSLGEITTPAAHDNDPSNTASIPMKLVSLDEIPRQSNSDADCPASQAQSAHSADLLLAAHPCEHQNEHRFGRNQQRREARRDVLLGPVQ